MLPLLLIFSDWSLFILRLIFGGVIFKIGWQKFKKTKLIGLLDLVGGACIFLGLLVQWLSLIIAIEFLFFIIWSFKRKDNLKAEAFSFNLILFAVALYFFTKGAGIYALDQFLFLIFFQ